MNRGASFLIRVAGVLGCGINVSWKLKTDTWQGHLFAPLRVETNQYHDTFLSTTSPVFHIYDTFGQSSIMNHSVSRWIRHISALGRKCNPQKTSMWEKRVSWTTSSQKLMGGKPCSTTSQPPHKKLRNSPRIESYLSRCHNLKPAVPAPEPESVHNPFSHIHDVEFDENI